MVRRNVNLRSDPSTSVNPISLLTPPAQLTLVEPNQQDAFYHVRTSDGKEGWVWAKNITLNPPAPTRLGPPEIYPDSAKTPGLSTPASHRTTSPRTYAIQPGARARSAHLPATRIHSNKTRCSNTATCILSSSNKSCYEEDHLISLENGGHPRDPRNLWPEPYNTQIDGQTIGARQKDTVENYIHNAICLTFPATKATVPRRILR